MDPVVWNVLMALASLIAAAIASILYAPATSLLIGGAIGFILAAVVCSIRKTKDV